MIRKVTSKDVKEIINIIKSVHIKNISNLDNGFLASENLSEDYYIKMINDYDYYYVCEMENNIKGFLLAYSKKFIKRDGEIGSYLLDKYKGEDFIYIFQIAVDPNCQNRGIGKALYEKLFNEAKIKKFKVITSKEPLNKASRLFHQSLGFKDADTFVWSDGIKSYVYNYEK
ncbi:MAG: GNAT family N-acetyltransferase [Candidatus Pacebacteria bacterium]|nr:GNAT family N-acetyltransferase [Candidatus Paceibacterota bacterium]